MLVLDRAYDLDLGWFTTNPIIPLFKGELEYHVYKIHLLSLGKLGACLANHVLLCESMLCFVICVWKAYYVFCYVCVNTIMLYVTHICLTKYIMLSS